MPSKRRVVVRTSVVALLLASTTAVARAEPCTGEDVTELLAGCSVLVDNEDFALKLYPTCGNDVSTPQGIRDTLDRVFVYVHGYGVTDTDLPPLFDEGFSSGQSVARALDRSGIARIGMAPGDSKADRVEDDAAAFEAALRLVEGYRNRTALPMVVFAHSMGGLLARIALARMEADVGHDVGLYVSYDSPHSGVNVPQGMQNLKVKLDEWAAMTEQDFIAVNDRWRGVFRAADMFGMTTTFDPSSVGGVPDPVTLQAQQMTIQSVMGPAEHMAFRALLDEVGFPEVRKIAISNGNTQGLANTQQVEPGGELFFFTGAKGNSVSSVRLTFEVFTDNPAATCFKSDVYYDAFMGGNVPGGRKDATTPADLVTMDHLSGGTLDYAGEMDGAAKAARGLHNPSHRAASGSAIPFVPTSSAFGLSVTTANEALAGIVAARGTPFDAVYAVGDMPAYRANNDHNLLVMPDVVLDEIESLLTGFTYSGPDLDGDGVSDACDEDRDGDGVRDDWDNCPDVANPDQADMDENRVGDACDDVDEDGIVAGVDNCPWVFNPKQEDVDGNGVGDACEVLSTQQKEPPHEAGCGGCSASPGLGLVGLWLVVGLRRGRRKRLF